MLKGVVVSERRTPLRGVLNLKNTMNYQNSRRLVMGLLVCAGAVILWQRNSATHSGNLQTHNSGQPIVATAPSPKPAQRNLAMTPQAPAAQTSAKFQILNDPDAAPVWAVKFGGEFWRHHLPVTGEDAAAGKASTLINPPFSLGDVIERVSHAVDTDPVTGNPQIAARNYVAQFDGQGMEFSPSKPGVGQPIATSGSLDDEGTAANSSQQRKASASSSQPTADPATQILFHTAAIERDGQVFYSADQNPSQWVVTGNTVQGLLSPSSGIVEHYQAVNDGVEVAWVFQNELPGSGPIEICATVDGLSYAGETDLGQHFADSSGVARVYVGQAEAVDSLGNRWSLTTYSVSGSSKLVVELPAAIQDEAVYPLVVDPIIGPEFGVDQPVSIAASGNQQTAAVTCGAGMYFVAWQDNRNSVNTGSGIYGTRVSSAGAVLDPFGIAICTAGSGQATPTVAASGTTFLVAWQDGRLGGNDIFGARISSTTGAVLDPLGLAISFDPAQNAKANPSIAGGSSGFFATWEDKRNAVNTQIFGARVSTAGTVMDPTGIGLSATAANQFHPTVVCNSNSYFVAWEDDRSNSTNGPDIYGGRVGTNGIVLDTNGVPLCTVTNSQTTPVAAINHGTVLVTWRDQRVRNNRTNDIFGTRVNFTNNTVNVLDPLGIVISSNGVSQTPAICAFTNGFLVVWSDKRSNSVSGTDIYGARVDTNGVLTDTNGFAICADSGNQVNPALAANSSNALVVWTDPRNSADTGNDIYGTRISSLGVVEDTNDILISRSGSEESSPAVAFNGTNYLVVWQDERNFMTNSTDIIGTRVSAAGTVLDLHGINICTQLAAQQHPSVGASGGEFLVAWEDSRNLAIDGVDIYGTRVDGTGAVLDPAGLALSATVNNKFVPSVAGNQSTFLVAWNDTQAAAPGIYGTLVSRSGSISNPGGFTIAAATGGENFPSIAANSNQFLVAFEDDSAPAGPDVFASRVANSGTVLDPSGSANQLAFNNSESTPAAASLGTNYLVAWTDGRNSVNSSSDIYAARVMGDGSTPDSSNPNISGFPVCTLPNNQVNPAVSADQNTGTYVVAWQNQGATDGNDLCSARIGTNGTVLDFWTQPLAGTGDRVSPELAYGGAGKFLVVSEAFRANSTVVVGNLMSADPPLANLMVQFTSPNYSVKQDGKFAQVMVKVTGKYSGEVTVDFATADGTAVAGVDYMPAAGRLVFSAKKTSATVLIPIIDTGAPTSKTVNLTLQNPMGGVLIGAQPTATLTITP